MSDTANEIRDEFEALANRALDHATGMNTDTSGNAR